MYKEIKDFVRTHKLGEGTYGIIFKAYHKKTNQVVAIKTFRIMEEDEDGIRPTTLREVMSLKELVHPNIVPLLGACYRTNQLYLIFEYLQCDLYQYLELDQEPLSLSLIQSFLYQILQGLCFCHIRGFLHRDLKPQNILVNTETMTLKIADFGLARRVTTPIKPLTHEVITLWYRPPEILLGSKRYGAGADVWSVGCIFAELASKIALFPKDSEISLLHAIFGLIGTPSEEELANVMDTDTVPQFPVYKSNIDSALRDILIPEGLNLIKGMLMFTPIHRTTVKQALRHAYFADLDKGTVPLYGNEFTCPLEAARRSNMK